MQRQAEEEARRERVSAWSMAWRWVRNIVYLVGAVWFCSRGIRELARYSRP